MGFFNSPLIQNLQQGELPEIKTVVEIPTDTLVRLGVTLVLVMGVVLVFVALMKGQKTV
jgi:hypothetical protein